MITIQDMFKLGLKRDLPELLWPSGTCINLGAGDSLIAGFRSLDLPEWDGDRNALPYHEGTVDHVVAFHFLEHLIDPIGMLGEIQRVLKPGGVASIVVPHGHSDLAIQDLDHKHFFTEKSWRTLFNNKWYGKYRIDWKLKVHANFIMGENFRNLALFTQLVKQTRPEERMERPTFLDSAYLSVPANPPKMPAVQAEEDEAEPVVIQTNTVRPGDRAWEIAHRLRFEPVEGRLYPIPKGNGHVHDKDYIVYDPNFGWYFSWPNNKNADTHVIYSPKDNDHGEGTEVHSK